MHLWPPFPSAVIFPPSPSFHSAFFPDCTHGNFGFAREKRLQLYFFHPRPSGRLVDIWSVLVSFLFKAEASVPPQVSGDLKSIGELFDVRELLLFVVAQCLEQVWLKGEGLNRLVFYSRHPPRGVLFNHSRMCECPLFFKKKRENIT